MTVDDYFKHLATAGVRFYDPQKKQKPLFTPKPAALAAHHIEPQNIHDFFALDDVDDLVDYVGDEGGYDDEVPSDEDEEDEVEQAEASTDKKDDDSDPVDDPFS